MRDGGLRAAPLPGIRRCQRSRHGAGRATDPSLCALAKGCTSRRRTRASLSRRWRAPARSISPSVLWHDSVSERRAQIAESGATGARESKQSSCRGPFVRAIEPSFEDGRHLVALLENTPCGAFGSRPPPRRGHGLLATPVQRLPGRAPSPRRVLADAIDAGPGAYTHASARRLVEGF